MSCRHRDVGLPRSGLDAAEGAVCADGEGSREGGTPPALEVAADAAEQGGEGVWAGAPRARYRGSAQRPPLSSISRCFVQSLLPECWEL